MKPCNDLNKTRDVRCVRDEGHDQLHRAGLFVWGEQDPYMPEWRKHLTAKDLTPSRAA